MNKCKKQMNEIYSVDAIMVDGLSTIFNIYADESETTYVKIKDFITEDNVDMLNQDYFIGYSADKYISPLHEKILNAYNDLSDSIVALAKIIYNRFADKWGKIYDALMTNYNPLENYSMEEERTPDLTFEDTENVKSDVKTERTTSAESKYKGFNADEPVTITTTDGSDDVETSGAKLDNETTKTTTHTGTETLSRSGNIGVTTSQQMLESEFKVRQYDFYKMIYNDIDSVLCLGIY